MEDQGSEIQERGRALIALAAAEFPKEFDLAADETWPMVASVLVSRMIATLESILDQQEKGREADSGSDARRLLEHATLLAWLAADSSTERIDDWRGADLRAGLAADTDARAHGESLFSDEPPRQVGCRPRNPFRVNSRTRKRGSRAGWLVLVRDRRASEADHLRYLLPR